MVLNTLLDSPDIDETSTMFTEAPLCFEDGSELGLPHNNGLQSDGQLESYLYTPGQDYNLLPHSSITTDFSESQINPMTDMTPRELWEAPTDLGVVLSETGSAASTHRDGSVYYISDGVNQRDVDMQTLRRPAQEEVTAMAGWVDYPASILSTSVPLWSQVSTAVDEPNGQLSYPVLQGLTEPFDDSAWGTSDTASASISLCLPLTNSTGSTQRSAESSTRKRTEFNTDEQRWAATMARSHAADSAFIYSVSSTKVYCRPSCPARRPRRRQVRFFPFPGAVKRPCRLDSERASGAIRKFLGQ